MGCSACKATPTRKGVYVENTSAEQQDTLSGQGNNVVASSSPAANTPKSVNGTVPFNDYPQGNISAVIAKWNRNMGVGVIGAGATRIAARQSLMTSRVKRDATIFQTYRLTSAVLGTGISGAVRVATHKFTGKPYAIKTLVLRNIPPKRAAMLYNEVTIYLQLDHPNIAKLMEVYEEEQAIHLVMELCTGGELYDRLAAKKKYSEDVASRIASQMLSALGYCHSHRICHRDLKLENWVYADPSDDAPLKLIDFGFSRIFNPGIPMTAMHGTVYYVSPEVMDGCYEEKCDIWSIGVIIFMLLSGSPPFSGAYDHEILIKIRRASYSFAGSRWDGVSTEAKDFISSLLIKDPSKRPSAVEAMKHPWFDEINTKRNLELDEAILQRMRSFSLANCMKRAALGMIALSMSPTDLLDLEGQFKLLDKNQTGTIQLHELTSALSEKLHLDVSECQRIFRTLDQSGDHEVHYSEFMASTAHIKLLKDEYLVLEAFRKFDIDCNGYITVENLRQVLGDTYVGTRVEDIVKFCDHKGDNVIDYEEFLSALTSDDTYDESFNINVSTPVKLSQQPRNKDTHLVLSNVIVNVQDEVDTLKQQAANCGGDFLNLNSQVNGGVCCTAS